MGIDLDALIASARDRLENVEPVTQEVDLGGSIVGVRVWPLRGHEWRDLTALHPWREGSQFDQNLGYNIDAVTRAYPRVALVQGDDVEDVSARWADILDVLSGPDLKNIALAVWGVNEFDPQKRMTAAGKASTGGRKRKRSSPVTSASQPES